MSHKANALSEKQIGVDNNYFSPRSSLCSSPEHEVLRMSYCDSAVSVVRHGPLVTLYSTI